MDETELKPPKKRRARRSRAEIDAQQALGMTVTVTLRGRKPESFQCSQRVVEGPFLVFLGPSQTFGKVLRRQFAIAEIARLEIEEAQFQQFQPQAWGNLQIRTDYAGTGAPLQPQPESQLYVSPPMAQKLRTKMTSAGPVSETADGIVPAGFYEPGR